MKMTCGSFQRCLNPLPHTVDPATMEGFLRETETWRRVLKHLYIVIEKPSDRSDSLIQPQLLHSVEIYRI